MDNLSPKQIQQINQLIEKRAKEIAEEVYNDKATQYGVAKVPIHGHNDIDSPILEGTSVKTFLRMPATPGGVFDPDILNGQSYRYNTLSFTPSGGNLTGLAPNFAVIYPPLATIIGYGVGAQSAFNGGDAPDGTMVLFTNAGTTGQLFVKMSDQGGGVTWRGVTLNVPV